MPLSCGRRLRATPGGAAGDGRAALTPRHKNGMALRMLLYHLLDVIAVATGHLPGALTGVARSLRQADMIAGKGRQGQAAVEATVRDATRVLLALASGGRRTEAAADLERTLGLVTDVDGREQSLADTVELMLEALIATETLVTWST